MPKAPGRIADIACTVILFIAAVYFGTIVAYAWWAGRFAEVAK
jgi:hypothetical protein